MVFVGRTHAIYTEPDAKTPKRVGGLVKSPKASLHGMLMAHQKEVQDYITSKISTVQIPTGPKLLSVGPAAIVTRS